MADKVSIKLLIFLVALGYSFSSYGLGLKWAGCGITKKAFMAELASAYERKTGIRVELEGGGATKGIQQVISRNVDIGGSCRFRVDEDNASRSRIVFNPVAWDALTVVVHNSNPLESVTLEQLRGIYTGSITNWSELGGPDQALHLYVREGKISGVGHAIRQLLFNDPEMEFAGHERFPSSGPLEKGIEQNPNAIGMTGISSARKRDFKILKLDGKEPSFDNIKKGSYLLYRPLYIVTNKESDNYTQVKRFLTFTHSREGRDIMRDNGVVPYLEAVWLSGNLQRQWSDSRKIRN